MKLAAWLLVPVVLLAGCSRPGGEAPAAPGAEQAAEVAAGPPPRLWTQGTQAVPVIMYHDVVPEKEVWFDLTVREFEAQMQALADAGASVIRVSDLVNHLRDGQPLPPRAIVLTFDDGTLGNYEHAYPILRRHNFPATFFVHTDYVGVKTVKDHMTWDQMREMQSAGLIDIQPHTASHPEDLRTLDDDAVRREFARSNETLEREMGYAPKHVAYPTGHADDRVRRLAAEAGYEAAFTEQRAWAASPADGLFLARFAPFRFDEILANWKREQADPRSGATLDARASADAEAVNAPGVLTGRIGTWAADEMGPDGGVLLRGERYRRLPDARQHGSIGRPFIVANGERAFFAGYQPWMGAERPALDLMLPDATLAVMGDAWLVHEGQPTTPAPRIRRGRRILGVTDDGRPFSLRTDERATAAAVVEQLQRLKAREAVLL